MQGTEAAKILSVTFLLAVASALLEGQSNLSCSHFIMNIFSFVTYFQSPEDIQRVIISLEIQLLAERSLPSRRSGPAPLCLHQAVQPMLRSCRAGRPVLCKQLQCWLLFFFWQAEPTQACLP